MQGADQRLIVAGVAQCAPRRADAGAERRLRDDAALPDRVDQLVLAHDPVAVSDEMNEQIEHLRLEVNDRAGAPQLAPSQIDLEVGEAQVQSLFPTPQTADLPPPQKRWCAVAAHRFTGNTIPQSGILQTIFKEIPERPEPGLKPVTSSAASGTNGNNIISVSKLGDFIQVVGAPASVAIFHAEAANDRLTINGLGGDDVIDATALPAGQINLTLNGGLGADVVLGSQGDDLVNGGDGNDAAFLGGGNDVFVWNPGDDNDTVEGQAGTAPSCSTAPTSRRTSRSPPTAGGPRSSATSPA